MDDRLQASFDRIGDLAADLAVRLDGGPPADMTELCRLRWTFARELMLHLAKAGRICGPTPDPEGDALRTLVAEQLKQWTIDRIVADWPGYRAATLRMIRSWNARNARRHAPPRTEIVEHRSCLY